MRLHHIQLNRACHYIILDPVELLGPYETLTCRLEKKVARGTKNPLSVGP